MNVNPLHLTACGNRPPGSCRRTPSPWLNLSLCLVLYLLVFPASGEVTPAPATHDAVLKTAVTQLSSANDAERHTAATVLIKLGTASLQPVLDGMAAGSAVYRQAAIAVIAGLKQDHGFTALVNLAMTDPDADVRAAAIDVLRTTTSPAVRQQVLGLLQNTDAKVRTNAAELARAIGYTGFVDDLLKTLEKQLHASGRSVGGMNINMNSTNFKGYDDFSADYVVGGQKVHQTIKMPVVKSTSIKTAIALPAASALVTLTGENYGTDLKKWQHWWKQSKKNLPKTDSSLPENSH